LLDRIDDPATSSNIIITSSGRFAQDICNQIQGKNIREKKVLGMIVYCGSRDKYKDLEKISMVYSV